MREPRCSIVHRPGSGVARAVSSSAVDAELVKGVAPAPPSAAWTSPAVQAGQLAAQHLIERGRRRLATVTGPLDLPAARDRLEGFRQAAEQAGHAPVAVVEGEFTMHSSAAAMKALFKTDPDGDGVFAANDLMAQGVVQVLREYGRRGTRHTEGP